MAYQQNQDGSIIIPPGGEVPSGYQAVQQGYDGSTYAVPMPRPQSSGSNPAGAALGTYGLYQAGKQLYNAAVPASAAAPATPSVLSIGGAAPVAAPSVAAPATPQVLSIGGAPPVPAGGFQGLAGGQIGLGSGLAGAAGLYGLHNLYGQGNVSPGGGALQGAASGAGIGFMAGGPIGAGIGAGVGGIAGLVKGLRSGKNEFEQMQEDTRTRGGQAGLFYRPNGASQAHMQLADGQYVNVEKTGYMVDEKAAGSHQAVAWANPLALALTGGHGPKGEVESPSIYLAGTIANGAMSNAGGDLEMVRANILKQIENMGQNQESLTQQLGELFKAGKIAENEYQAALNSLDVLFSGDQSRYATGSMADFKAGQSGEQSASTTTPARGEGPAPLPQTYQLPEGHRVATGAQMPENTEKQKVDLARMAQNLGSFGSRGQYS